MNVLINQYLSTNNSDTIWDKYCELSNEFYKYCQHGNIFLLHLRELVFGMKQNIKYFLQFLYFSFYSNFRSENTLHFIYFLLAFYTFFLIEKIIMLTTFKLNQSIAIMIFVFIFNFSYLTKLFDLSHSRAFSSLMLSLFLSFFQAREIVRAYSAMSCQCLRITHTYTKPITNRSLRVRYQSLVQLVLFSLFKSVQICVQFLLVFLVYM